MSNRAGRDQTQFHIKGTCWLLHECDPDSEISSLSRPCSQNKADPADRARLLHNLHFGSIYDCYSCFYFEVSHISVFIRCRSTLFLGFNSTSLKSTRAFSVNRVNPIFKCCFFFADKVIINDPKSAVYTHSGASCPAPNQALEVNLVYSVLQMIVSCL